MKANRYYHWLLKSKKKQLELKNWVVDKGGEVFEGSGLQYGEVIKFKIKNSTCTLWVTGYSCVGFKKAMLDFLKENAR